MSAEAQPMNIQPNLEPGQIVISKIHTLALEFARAADGWFTTKQLAKWLDAEYIFGCSVNKAYSLLTELANNGYLERTKQKTHSNGKRPYPYKITVWKCCE